MGDPSRGPFGDPHVRGAQALQLLLERGEAAEEGLRVNALGEGCEGEDEGGGGQRHGGGGFSADGEKDEEQGPEGEGGGGMVEERGCGCERGGAVAMVG